MRHTLLSIFLGFVAIAASCDSTSEGGGSSSSSSSSGSAVSSSSSSGAGGEAGSGGQGTGGTGGQGTGGAGGAMAGCRTGMDCGAGNFCSAYTLAPLCMGQEDMNFSNNCAMDSDCTTANDICDSTLCIIPHGGAITPPHCRPGCSTAADCGPGYGCSATHHCDAATCAMNSDCGSGNFVCTAGQCARKDCTKDADCTNYCVNGACWANLGECKPAVP